MTCFVGTQEPVTLFTQAWTIGKQQFRDYSKIIFLVHIVGYWVQSYLTLPEMSEKLFFPCTEHQIQAEAVLLVTIDRLIQGTGMSQFVLASILLISWKLEDIRRLPSMTLHMITGEHVFTGERTLALWNNTCILPYYCPLLEMMGECSSRASEHDLPAEFKLLWQALEMMPGHCWAEYWDRWSWQPASSCVCCHWVHFSSFFWTDLMSDY